MPSRKLLVIFLALVMVSALGATGAHRLLANVESLDAGACAAVPIDPATGERLVQCCLDELYVFQNEGTEEETEAFLQALESIATMEVSDALDFFAAPYESTLHEKYGWSGFCQDEIPCELCKVAPLCGNGVVQTDEELEIFEECDDGNKVDGDGCSAKCTFEEVEAVEVPEVVEEPPVEVVEPEPVEEVEPEPIPEPVEPAPKTPVCGDIVLDPGEECDDGNLVNGDGCSAACTLEAVEAAVLEPVAAPVLNRGPRRPTLVEGEPDTSSTLSVTKVEDVESPPAVVPLNAVEADKSAAPSDPPPVEAVEVTNSAPTQCQTAVVIALCGNGIIEPPEHCDDRNLVPGDGCSPDCQLEPNATKRPSQEPGSCGDGVHHVGEQCDDGNFIIGDGCDARCRRESSQVTGQFTCGNGQVDAGEECDDGNTLDGDGCTPTCFWEAGDRDDCIVQRAFGEQCAVAVHDSSVLYSCSSAGQFILPRCGNGLLDPGEYCDEGDSNANTPNALCRRDCTLGRCGDGILDAGEQCDDGNLVSDGCDRYCILSSPVTAATATAQRPPARPPAPRPAAPPPPPRPDLPLPIPSQRNLADLKPAAAYAPPPVRTPLSQSGPAVLVVIIGGAAAGAGVMRRRKGVRD